MILTRTPANNHISGISRSPGLVYLPFTAPLVLVLHQYFSCDHLQQAAADLFRYPYLSEAQNKLITFWWACRPKQAQASLKDWHDFIQRSEAKQLRHEMRLVRDARQLWIRAFSPSGSFRPEGGATRPVCVFGSIVTSC